MSNCGEDDLEKLFEGIDLEKQETGSDNDYRQSLSESQVPLFLDIESVTGMSGDEILIVALGEGTMGQRKLGQALARTLTLFIQPPSLAAQKLYPKLKKEAGLRRWTAPSWTWMMESTQMRGVCPR